MWVRVIAPICLATLLAAGAKTQPSIDQMNEANNPRVDMTIDRNHP